MKYVLSPMQIFFREFWCIFGPAGLFFNENRWFSFSGTISECLPDVASLSKFTCIYYRCSRIYPGNSGRDLRWCEFTKNRFHLLYANSTPRNTIVLSRYSIVYSLYCWVWRFWFEKNTLLSARRRLFEGKGPPRCRVTSEESPRQ